MPSSHFVCPSSRSYDQGLTQKHPWLVQRKTSPGWQVTAKLRFEGIDEERKLACCPWALDPMIVAHSRVLAMKNFLSFSILTKPSWLYGPKACAGIISRVLFGNR